MNTNMIILSAILVGLVSSAKLPPAPFAPGSSESIGQLRIDVLTDDHVFQEAELMNTPSRSAVKGSYSFTAPNGQRFTICYIADERGYRTYPIRQGANCDLPKPTTTTTPAPTTGYSYTAPTGLYQVPKMDSFAAFNPLPANANTRNSQVKSTNEKRNT